MKSGKFWACLIAGIIVLSLCGTLLVYRASGSGTTACIYSGGELVEKIDLSAVTETYSFTVTGENGRENVITVEPGGISVTAADCPDKICVRRGVIKNGVVPIVCLPNGLIIKIEDADSDIDGVSG